MENNYKIITQEELKKIGATNINSKTINQQEIFSFVLEINNKTQSIMLFQSIYKEAIVNQFFCSFPQKYIMPQVDFYRIIDKLNMNCIMGHIFFIKENEDFYLSYKSNYIGDLVNFSGNKSFNLFLSASVDMVAIFDNELNIL